MTQSFFIPGPLPAMNDYAGRGSWGYRGAKKHWAETIGWEIVKQKLRPMKRVYIRWTWQEENQRRDPDNFAAVGKKFILDALVAQGILPDDGWQEIAGWEDRWVVVKESPGVRVELEDV